MAGRRGGGEGERSHSSHAHAASQGAGGEDAQHTRTERLIAVDASASDFQMGTDMVFFKGDKGHLLRALLALDRFDVRRAPFKFWPINTHTRTHHTPPPPPS
eukprot:scaffold11755_cov67-Isochrysis_galbana.AAC.2